ncbi:MAG: enoyl-CoA hydratase [Acidimicrobiia bacterium]|nr:enoyl-CoA hydratase [Acidimicrobiia bacterium]
MTSTISGSSARMMMGSSTASLGLGRIRNQNQANPTTGGWSLIRASPFKVKYALAMSDLQERPRYVRTRVQEHVGWLEFDRAPVNAFEWTMVRQVSDALDAFEHDATVRVVVMASALERYFSAGADLDTFRDLGEAGMAEWCELVHRIVGQLRSSTKPLLAAIGGVAVGGGLEMTLHCDVRFAARDARLGQPEVNINFIPPVGATQALARLIGRPRALRYLYDGELLSAAQAQMLGLVDEVVEAGELRQRVQGYARSLAAKPPEALAAIRRSITIGGATSFDEGLALERGLAISLAGTANFREGVQAFLEHRPPRWVL